GLGRSCVLEAASMRPGSWASFASCRRGRSCFWPTVWLLGQKVARSVCGVAHQGFVVVRSEAPGLEMGLDLQAPGPVAHQRLVVVLTEAPGLEMGLDLQALRLVAHQGFVVVRSEPAGLEMGLDL